MVSAHSNACVQGVALVMAAKGIVHGFDGGRATSVDGPCRKQIAVAALLLRSIRPRNGEVEILLHEMARRLEQIAEAGEVLTPDNRRYDA